MALKPPVLNIEVSSTSAKVYDAGYRNSLSVQNTGNKTIFFGYGIAAVAGSPEGLGAGDKGEIEEPTCQEAIYAICAPGESSTLAIQEV